MMVVFPHFEDKNLELWMARPRSVQNGGGARTDDTNVREVDLSEALKNFHIASRQVAANSNGGAPTILLPPILTSSNSATWLSTRGHKKLNSTSAKVSNNNDNDLSKWLAGGNKKSGVLSAAADYSKWLKKTVPTGSCQSSLPGIRVEFPEIPLSAFRRPETERASTMSSTSGSSSDIEKWLQRPGSRNNNNKDEDRNKWLFVSDAAMDVDNDDDDDGLAQWLLVGKSERQVDPVRSGLCSGSSDSKIEEWLLAAAADRDPSIVVIDDENDFDDDVTSGSGYFGTFSNFN